VILMRALRFPQTCSLPAALLVLAATLAVLPAARAEAQYAATATAAPFDPDRDAARDVAAAAAKAKAEGKRVLVDVGGEWCSWCHLLDRFFAADNEARDVRDANYVLVKVNYSTENRNKAFLSRYPAVAGYPHLFVLDSDGKLVHSQDTGELEQGEGYSRDKMIAFLKRWAAPAKSAGATVPWFLGFGSSAWV
jgi:thiol:disulfide interchange protein